MNNSVANPALHVRGVDSLRFVAAMWVAFGHGAALPVNQLLQGTGWLGRLVSAFCGVLFNGHSAVFVFFVISGFCIHLPFVAAEKIKLREYFIRRYVRIGGPLLAVLLLGQLWSDPAARAVNEVLWSVYCELAYYTLYPLLFRWFRRYGFNTIIAAATVISAIFIVARLSYRRHWQFGPLSFLVACPPWLLGCLLADRVRSGKSVASRFPIWYWRGGAWVYTVLAMIAIFHAPVRIGYTVSLLPFAFYCYFWLEQELLRWRTVAPIPWLEAAGGWSFSVYLVHKIVLTKFAELKLPLAPILNWALMCAAILTLSYLFYLIIERPSHTAARRLARFVGRPAPVVRTAVETQA